jgi:hypothetical protein
MNQGKLYYDSESTQSDYSRNELNINEREYRRNHREPVSSRDVLG